MALPPLPMRAPAGSLLTAQSVKEPCSREGPVAFRRSRGTAEKCGGFFDAETAEEAQLDQSREPWLLGRKLVERAIEVDELHGIHRRRHSLAEIAIETVVKLHHRRAGAALLRQIRSGMIDQDATHDPRCNSEKMGAIMPRNIAEAAQTEIRLVGKSRRLQRVPRAFGPELPGRNRPELGVHHRQEPFERAVVPLFPGVEDFGDGQLRGHPGIYLTPFRISCQCH